MTQQHQQQNSANIFEFEAHIAHFKTQLNACFALQRAFANSVSFKRDILKIIFSARFNDLETIKRTSNTKNDKLWI